MKHRLLQTVLTALLAVMLVFAGAEAKTLEENPAVGSSQAEQKTAEESPAAGNPQAQQKTDEPETPDEEKDAEAKEEAGSADIREESEEILSAKEAMFGDILTADTDPQEGSETEKTEDEAGGDAEPEPEGILSVPDHPLSVTADKMVFIGDSRTVDMMNAVQDDSIWCCKVSMGYNWMVTEGVPAVDGYIDNNTAVIILLGVNDPHNISNYIGYTNEKAAEWAGRGATTYFVSVGPVTGDPYVTNADIEAFNAALQANLSGVYYIDIYSYLMENGFSTVDGTHYPADVSIAIYNYIIDHLEENRSGIWG